MSSAKAEGDLAVTDSASWVVEVLRGNGDGTFQSPASFLTNYPSHFVAVADLEGDNLPDLVTVSPGNDRVTVLLNLPEPSLVALLASGIGGLLLLNRGRSH